MGSCSCWACERRRACDCGPPSPDRKTRNVTFGHSYMGHKAQQQDKVYEEREESCWILHLRTSIFYPKGHKGVMNEVPDGAAIFASSYWLRNSDMY
ncbi:hypothetical protein Tco_0465148 [Tanacetum coccineum]